jgi:hypothetical protein
MGTYFKGLGGLTCFVNCHLPFAVHFSSSPLENPERKRGKSDVSIEKKVALPSAIDEIITRAWCGLELVHLLAAP